MTHESRVPADDRQSPVTQKSPEMRHADTANGENPDDDIDESSPATQDGEQVAPDGTDRAK